MLKLIFPILLLIILAPTPARASISHECIDKSGDFQCDQQTCFCTYNVWQAYFTFSIQSVTIILSLMLIYGFLAVKQIRNSPGDIIFMLAVTDLAMAISNAYYSYKIITDGQQDPYGKTCLNTAIVTSVASDLNDMYNLSFFVFFILSIRSIWFWLSLKYKDFQ